MKLLCIADNKPNPVLTQSNLQNHDAVITLGDLGIYELQDLKKWNNIPKMGVHGNHDRDLYFEHYNIFDLHLNIIHWGGMTWGGFQGCNRYKNTGEYQYTQEQANFMLNDFPAVDVMICHSPPFGINDHEDQAHQGFQALKTYIEKNSPKHFFHGHTYPEDNLVTCYKSTQIHYVWGAKTIEIWL